MNSKLFFSVFALVIILIRIFLHFYPVHAHAIGGFQPHHYMYGIFLIIIYFLLPRSQPFSTILLAIGIALGVDEIPLFFIFKTWNWPDNHWVQYQSFVSVIGVTLRSAMIYLFLS